MEELHNIDKKYCRPISSPIIKYGTAGFRDKAVNLTHVMPRCGVVAVLSSYLQDSRPVGLMVTASHNPAPDNGVKLVAKSGEMVKPNIEELAIALVNSSDFPSEVEKKCKDIGLSGAEDPALKACTVIIGYDTRESSEGFAFAIKEVIAALGAKCIDLGVVTTPMLHFAVWHFNEFNSVGTPEKYFQFFSQKFSNSLPRDATYEPTRLIFDGACGVGAIHADSFAPTLKQLNVSLEVINHPGDGILNSECGSDHVQVSQKAPNHFNHYGHRACSVDGDADRLVYYFQEANGKFNLIDGDKIAILYFQVLNKFILSLGGKIEKKDPLSIAVVQTAYANGASTDAMKQLIKDPASMASLEDIQVDVHCAKTGVKNLHHVAENADIGIYFEANGHGTVIFKKDRVLGWGSKRGVTETENFKELLSFLELFNAAVGDAYADLLACEVGLKVLNWSMSDWISVYTGFPNSQTKVVLTKDKMSSITPHPDHERWLISPLDVQKVIDDTTSKYDGCRAFIRPSGTEPLVRLYVEALRLEDREAVTKSITDFVTDRFK